MITLLLAFALGFVVTIFASAFFFKKNRKEEKELDKTTYTNGAINLYYLDGTKEVFFYHKGCWYLKSENPKRDKYAPCNYDTSRWLDKKLASIELTEKYKQL